MKKSSALRFEWDDEKNKTNIRKHKVSFETSMRMLYWSPTLA